MMTSHSLLGRHCQLSLVFDNFDIDVHGRLDTVRRQEIWKQVQNFQLSLLMASFKDLCLHAYQTAHLLSTLRTSVKISHHQISHQLNAHSA